MSYTFHVVHPREDAETVNTVQRIINMSKEHGEEALSTDFNPDVEALLVAWNAGAYKVFAAKTGDRIAGYAIWSFGAHPFKQHEVDAVLIAAFVDCAHRGKGAFGLLLEESRKAVKYAGATRVAVAVDDGHRMQTFFEAKGWTQSVRIYQEPK